VDGEGEGGGGVEAAGEEDDGARVWHRGILAGERRQVVTSLNRHAVGSITLTIMIKIMSSILLARWEF
jgi:hypothetical protein